MGVLCCVTFNPLCVLSGHTVVDTALGPTLTVGMLVIGPGVSQTLFSQGQQHRSTEFRSQECNNYGSGPAVDAMGQLRLWPGPTPMCMCP